MNRGKLISIEGIEGAGKTTAMEFVKQFFSENKMDIVWTREPGGTPIAEEIRDLVLHSTQKETIEAEAELLLMFASRVQHMQKIILPALSQGKWVVTDRFIDASYAYQCGGRGVDAHYIEFLDRWIVGELQPDLTLLLDVTPEIGFARTQTRGLHQDRIEHESSTFFQRVRQVYLNRAEQFPHRIHLIDATQNLKYVEKEIRHILDELMASELRVH